MDSKIGLIIQLAGVSLITLLTLFLRRSLNVVALKHWTIAWLFLSFSLFCLRLAFSYETYSLQLFSFYFLTEYFFGFLLIAGIRSLVGNNEMKVRAELWILPFILVAFGLPFLADDLNLVLNSQSLILAGFFSIAFIELWKTKIRSFGGKVMLIALALLTVNYGGYFVIFMMGRYADIETSFLAFNSVIDLVLQILLGFGMVIVLLEQVLTDAKIANEKLRKAHERLEELAHIDPLTTALNRHAFHGYLNRGGDSGRAATGCVGFFDIDDLKDINDLYGHAAGDMAIRAVVRSIRDIIRAEDLIFRWGGDEFFVIMVGLDSDTALDRMSRLEETLSNVRIDGLTRPLAIRVSHAFEDFNDLANLESTIEKADAKMYLQKQKRKAVFADKLLTPSRSIRHDLLPR
ncbi:MAG: GGDEF domain-containing protein [Pyrinomonadaceae bacterium]|nr:GGDEF domain-containing protein [Acidobacteriota bacterium]MBK7933145.1 GGDEF domain-containing protein [Acidobacteriota bacterium]MBP7375431.1 GGDEF domain-containing protein [Pyrinomonadaceae bacterium]